MYVPPSSSTDQKLALPMPALGKMLRSARAAELLPHTSSVTVGGTHRAHQAQFAMRVVIGEDEALLRAGLVHLLVSAGADVVGATGDARGLVRLAMDSEPDLLIADIRMPPGHADDGLLAALEVRRQRPATAIRILTPCRPGFPRRL